MRNIFLRLISVAIFLTSINSFAFKADAFKGAYPVLSPVISSKPSYLVLDTDTLDVIWSKYATGPLPNNLSDMKNSPVILAAITNTNIVFLTTESNALVSANFLHLNAGDSTMELARQPNGQFQLGVSQNGSISKYILDVPSPL